MQHGICDWRGFILYVDILCMSIFLKIFLHFIEYRLNY